MTRDEVLLAVNSAFNAKCEATVGFWNVRVDTNPPREIIFSADWVALHVNDTTEQIDNLVCRLASIGDKNWHKDDATGVLFYVVR